MARTLCGEDLELMVAEYDKLSLSEVSNAAVKQEEDKPGFALKIYEYAMKKFPAMPNDENYTSILSAVYTAAGKLCFFKEDYVRADAYLGIAYELNTKNMEASYWEGEVFYARGFIDMSEICH